MVVVITFDIDGTLVASKGPSANATHKDAFSKAIEKVVGLERASINEIPHHGMTDRNILRRLLHHKGWGHVSEETLDRLVQAMAEHRGDYGRGLEVLDGVQRLLKTLSTLGSERVMVGLVTGNVEAIAWAKMEAVGIAQYFTVPRFGGFGGRYEERADCIRAANQHAAEVLRKQGKKISRSFHVGDAPADITAAHKAGVHAVGVCTGIFDHSQLQECSRGHE
eukprot:Sspe_Gene.103503::Locus_79332_Transcript_1_1_Confidence_1.000_Length_717::g.103503::m.103503